MEQQIDPWMRRVGGCVISGFVLMVGLFLFLFGALVEIQGNSPHEGLINKATLGLTRQRWEVPSISTLDYGG
jgi:hypothetical protein